MRKITIDFETYCDLDIKLVGAFKYAHHPSCKILCMSYKIDNKHTGLWTPEKPWPKVLKKIPKEDRLYAFGATFEYLIWNVTGPKKHPEYFKPVPLSQFIDVRALCNRYRMPQDLAKAARALGCATEKMVIGKQLIRICCTPGHNPTKQHFKDLYKYCKVDTDVLHELWNRLPADHFTPLEQSLWELTFKMNQRGVPIDIKAVDSIIKYLSTYMESMKNILPDITKGYVQTAGQVQKIRSYCEKQGVVLPNLQAETVKQYLDTDLPDDVRTVLEIRQLTGLTSVKKFITIKNMYHNGYVQGNLNHHRAGTGRWGGQGFQYHNLPRAKRKDPEKWIKKFIKKEPIDRPIEIAKALIRPMIKAPKGYKLIISDYSAIEYILLIWLCGDTEALKRYKAGINQYKDMSAYVYKKNIEDIDKDSEEYIMGKNIVLGCGYQMGWLRFISHCANGGLEVTESQAQMAVDAYRKKYHKVRKTWKAFNNMVIAATRYPGTAYKTRKCTFKVVKDHVGRSWLRITLPSKRSLMYADPEVVEGNYGPVVEYTGQSGTTFQMVRIQLTPGLITENIIQAIARDILANGMLMVEKHMPEVGLSISVHDEAGGPIKIKDINKNTMKKFNKLLCTPLDWFKGLPLKAEGYIEKRYKKD